ncbi:choice-of-anchor I family protein [uncultured Pseudoflavonifractor sp.]|uniref:choice-of-anchor I family protein n=1 Tax=uncultured Pseudoflavonifractor sp. TaxID=1221379 RepID=UPI0025F6F750|nr:choice-of-anchor I family protein [uncultured Pseudoflavonifractor sp.]
MNLCAKRIGSLALAVLLAVQTLGTVPASAADTAEETETPKVVADWKFDQAHTTGSIADGSLIVEDQSGNDNDLRMETYGQENWEDYLSFSDDSMTGQGGSMVFDGDNSAKTGADFITVDGAAINSEEFTDGYTMEFLYYFPEDWTAADQWMSLIGRQGAGGGNPEGEQGTMYASISNCKEIQFITGNADGDHYMSSAAWSVSMDEGGVWYHIAIVSDGHEIATYVNGCEAFRDYVSDEMVGMYADPADGRFRVGSSWWDGLDKFLQGSLQEIRISGQPLDKDQWLVPNPEDYVENFGSNDTYTLRNEDNYNIVLIPDTQNTVEYCPDVMDTAIDQLIDTADELNVAGVIHLGDVVDDNNDDAQYVSARDAFYRLPDAGIKFLVQMGNHDGWSSGIHNYYNSFSGKSTAWTRRTGWYLTQSPNGDGNSSYMFLRAGSYNYLVISLSCTGSGSGANNNTGWNSADEAWLRYVLEEYPDCPTIVTTHDLQNCSDTQPSAIKLSAQGSKLWDIVKDYDQVFMLVGGHSHGSGMEELTNTNGNKVISILTDLQFAYNGGNGWFRYLEFDESADKIYYSVYSPYAASLDESEKSFFDVNFLTGPGNEGEIDLDFETRFPGMAREEQETQTEGQWMTGEYHTHTGQSKDATSAFMSLTNVLAAAFRNQDVLQDEANSAARFDNIQNGDAFDFLGLADHLRQSYNGVDGQGNGQYNTAFYVALQTQIREIEKLQVKGEYTDKLLNTGFEWDMPGLDHASVGILDEDGNASISGIHAFEWLYASQGSGDDPTSLFNLDEKSDDMDEQAVYGDRQNDGQAETAYDAVAWLEENYPGSYALPNHPSRHNGGSGEVTIENLRRLNDAAPSVVFGFEGMPGNQMSGSGRCELPAGAIRNGADEMIAVTGGVWDALLSEGRRFYNFANSDFHFKVSADENYSSGYWASEYSANQVWVEPGDDGQFTFSDVVEGIRSGNAYSVYGNLISDLSFTVSAADGSTATMGGELNVDEGDQLTVTVRFKAGNTNNYETLFNTDTGIDVDNTPELDHVDLIMGHVTGKVDDSQYGSTDNTDAKIVKTFTKEELAQALGEDGYYTLTFPMEADSDLYFRLRGTTVSEVDGNGDPLSDADYSGISDNHTRFDTINDSNYASLCFYANPIWVNVEQAPEAQTQGMENGSASLDLTKIAGYTSGQFDVDGGVMEIVAYNSVNGYAYAVNGKSGLLAVIPMGELEDTGVVTALTGTSFDVKSAVEAADSAFAYGDMTSVAVSPDGTTLAVALQAAGYADPGRVALFTCNADGSLTLSKVIAVGVQPDMVTFADNNTLLTADEGEPREGYGDGATDPKGSVTVVDVTAGTADVVDFTAFDEQREDLVAAGIVLKKDTAPSVDLEPEYIAVSGGKAYVTLQEANAIAVLDIASRTFTGIYSAGFEDYSTTPVDIDKKDEAYSPKTYESLMGIRMPDGIAAFEKDGKTYLLTANEGDSREWGDYLNEDEVNFGKAGKTSPSGKITAENSGLTGKVVFFLAEDYDGLNAEKDYLFGGRSFTLYQVTDTGIQEIFTSGDDFEALTAKYLPDYFNCSNDNATLDDRSGKKGPEAESVAVGTVDGRTYAFIALERTGGVMVYDVTDPAHVSYVNYINSRDFASVVPGSEEYDGGELDKWVTGGDVAPEGFAFVPAAVSPTGEALLLTACEVSGTVAVYELEPEETQAPVTGGGTASGSKTQTTTNPDGSVTTTVTRPDGSKTETTKAPNGATSVVNTSKDGQVEAQVTLTEKAMAAVEQGQAVALPMPAVTASDDRASAPTITVDLPGSSARVEIPVENVTPGTVAVLVKADGTESVIPTSITTENGVAVTLSDGGTVKIVDNTKTFADVPSGHWSEAAIAFAASRELFNGTGENTFDPAGQMTRAMILTVLARYDGQDTTGGSTWYEQGVRWAVDNGVSDGASLDSAVSREQLVTMLWRYAGSPAAQGGLNAYPDSASVSNWAAQAMAWAVETGLITGTGAGELNPQGTATRAEVAAILVRFVEKTGV